MIGHASSFSPRIAAPRHYHHHRRRPPCAIHTIATHDGGRYPDCFYSSKPAAMTTKMTTTVPTVMMVIRILPAKRCPSRRRLPLASKSTNMSISGDDATGHTITSAPVSAQALKVTALVGCALALCNADRTLMSVAIIPLMDAKGLSLSLAGIAQSAFLWGYAATPLAGGCDSCGFHVMYAIYVPQHV